MECTKTEVKHSLSKTAWNVVSTQLGEKYKIARVPYLVIEGNEIVTTRNKHEALEHALFISKCFNEKYGIQQQLQQQLQQQKERK